MTSIEPVEPTEQTKSRHPNWTSIYEKLSEHEIPWYLEVLDPDLLAALKDRPHEGRLLDIGCGTGAQAERLAELGFDVLGIDVSPSAIRIARERLPKSELRPAPKLKLEFQVADVLSDPLGQDLDFVVDRGCLHVLDPADYQHFARSIHRALAEGGVFFLKCFSDLEPVKSFGPIPLSLATIESEFGRLFRIVDARETLFQGPKSHKPKSLFIEMEKRP